MQTLCASSGSCGGELFFVAEIVCIDRRRRYTI